MTLGAYGPLTVDHARAMALTKLGAVVQGQDPLDERQQRQYVPTFGTYSSEYLEAVKRRKKQPRHDIRYLAMADEKWKRRPITAITPRDVQSLMLQISERGHTTANRWLASIRACLEEARRQGLIPFNPAMDIQAFRENPPRARVLDNEEYTAIVGAIEEISDPFVRLAFMLLRNTGARKSEVLTARWEHIDLAEGRWRIPSPKAGEPQVMPLDDDTVELLRGAERMGSWVIPGRDPNRHRSDLKRPWQKIRKATGLHDVTIHDVRRTFGLHVTQTSGLHVASRLLRHSDIRVTEKVYAPLGLAELREAMGATQRRRKKVVEGVRSRSNKDKE